jgi:predicted transport protein
MKKKEDLDVDIYKEGRLHNELWNDPGYKGHHTQRIDGESKIFEADIGILGKEIFKGKIDVGLFIKLTIKESVRLTDSVKVVHKKVDVKDTGKGENNIEVSKIKNMEEFNLIKPEKISLQNHPTLNERWIQKVIADDPSILGLGDLSLKDKERNQPRAGRLDLLLQDPEAGIRYEVEVQLGKTDESHIVRTIEYWDIEKKRYPQYEHYAVIVAEDITSRFLNVMNLLNGAIPIIAIQMNAYKIEDKYFLLFTKILDEINLGYVDEDEEHLEITDRNYWETAKGTKETVAMVDQLLEIIKSFAPEVGLNYTKFYIGLTKDGRPNNFAAFRPRKNSLKVEIRLEKSEEIDRQLEEVGLDSMEYDVRGRMYRISLTKDSLDKNQELLRSLLKLAYNKGR